jgi:hypothetical protein
MEKIINDTSFTLFSIQTIMFILFFLIIYYLIQLYRKVIKYLDRKKDL